MPLLGILSMYWLGIQGNLLPVVGGARQSGIRMIL